MTKVTDAHINDIKALFETGDAPDGDDFSTLITAVQEAAQDHEHKSTGGAGTGTGDAAALYVYKTLVFCVPGTVAVGETAAPSVIADEALTILKAYAYVRTAPTGAALIVDVNANGTTIFTTQENRPQIAIGEHTDESGTPDVTALAKNDRVDVDVDQVGSTVAGADLTVMVRCKQALVE